MLRRLIQSRTRRRITLAVLTLIVLLAASIQGIRANLYGPGVWVFFRGRLHAAAYRPVGTDSFRLEFEWTARDGAIHPIVTASVGDINFLQFGPDTYDWCGT